MQRWSVEPPTAEEIAQDDVEIEHEGTDEDMEADAVGDIHGGDPGPGNLGDPGAAPSVVSTNLPTAVDDGVNEDGSHHAESNLAVLSRPAHFD